jgi:phenylacetate-coenzyme A ligase PaaK-like adenylate-forming protein
MVLKKDNILSKRANEMFILPQNKWMNIDKIIYESPSYFNNDIEKIRKMRFKSIKESLNHHYSKSQFYNQLCKEYDFHPNDIKSEEDFKKVPMLPDTFFKEYPAENPKEIFNWLVKISTVELGEYDYQGKDLMGFLRWAEQRLEGLVNHSSGTTGHYSFMFRDKTTFYRFYYAIVNLLVDLCPPKGDPNYVYPGSPNTFLTIGKWLGEIAKVFSDSKRHFLTDREISMSIARLLATGNATSLKERFILRALKKAMIKGEDKMLSLLEKLDKSGEQSYIVSPPYQMYSIMLKMKENGMKLNLGDSNSFLLTGGGWKIFESRKVSEKDFALMAEETLGIPPERYTDLYGMSEMNGGAVSCKGRYKHLLPWIYPMVLDDSQGHIGFEEWGRFAFLDPVANSYPGFIISGDRVKLLEQCPGCDQAGPVLESDITRVAGAEAKGCANLMRGLMAEQFKKAEKKHRS